jgi:hypothetical protein
MRMNWTTENGESTDSARRARFWDAKVGFASRVVRPWLSGLTSDPNLLVLL